MRVFGGDDGVLLPVKNRGNSASGAAAAANARHRIARVARRAARRARVIVRRGGFGVINGESRGV